MENCLYLCVCVIHGEIVGSYYYLKRVENKQTTNTGTHHLIRIGIFLRMAKVLDDSIYSNCQYSICKVNVFLLAFFVLLIFPGLMLILRNISSFFYDERWLKSSRERETERNENNKISLSRTILNNVTYIVGSGGRKERMKFWNRFMRLQKRTNSRKKVDVVFILTCCTAMCVCLCGRCLTMYDLQ